jgi:hypothetical protein
MKKVIFNLSTVAAFILIIIFACDDTNTVEDIDNRVIPSENVSYSQHIQPVFNVKCNNSGCHNSIDGAGGLILSDWINTTADYLIVTPGKPNSSILVKAIQGQSANPMPPLGYSTLTTNQIEGIFTWIEEGALNN